MNKIIKTRRTLSEIYEFQYGKGNTNPDNGGEFPVYGSNGIIGYYSEFNSEDSPVIGHIGANCGVVVWGAGKHFVTYNGVIAKIKNGVDPKFGYYTLLSKDLRLLTRGSAQPFISYDMLNNTGIHLPLLPTQQKIAHTLSLLDAKIELNQKLNRQLESIAKTLYDYWFVQFDFPDADGKPYKSSGGRMVFSEVLGREVPEGWEIGTLLDIAELLGGGTPKTGNDEFWNGGIPFYTPKDFENDVFVISTKQEISEKGLKSCSSRLFPKGTIFITARGSVGNVNIAGVDMAMNQSCYALAPKANCNSIFLFHFTLQVVNLLKAKATGSIFDAIVSNDFKFAKTTIPKQDLIEKFGKTIEPVFNQILKNKTETRHLTHLRDFLLPLLMNGQVRVN